MIAIARIAMAMIVLGVFSLFFVKPGSANFYADIMGIVINVIVVILISLYLRGKTQGR